MVDADRLNGRRLLLAEELAVLAIDGTDRGLRATAALELAQAAAMLVELQVRGVVRVDGDAISVVDDWPTGDALLDEVVRTIRERPSATIAAHLDGIADSGLLPEVIGRLERGGIVARRRDTWLGLIPVTRWRIVPPRMRIQWSIRLRAIVRGVDLPDTREVALVPLLATIGALSAFLGDDERGAAHELARRLARREPILVALDARVAAAEADMAERAASVMLP